MGGALASAAAGGLTTFTVESAVSAGVATSQAGFLLTVASLVGLSMRSASGWFADHVGRGSLLLASSMIFLGAIGYVSLSVVHGLPAVAAATLLAFGGGWGYQGLIQLAVIRSRPDSPAMALGYVRVGPAIGAIFGPVTFGLIVTSFGYSAAWMMTAFAAVGGALLLLLGRQRQTAERFA
jgi:MFS family permease